MVLLVVGLAGFGIGVGGGLTTQDVARVGDQKVTADQYGRAVDQQVRRISAQIDRNLTMSEARQYGIDRLALIQLVNDAALDGEAERIGLSVGDDAVRDELRQIPAFQGSDGFDRWNYGRYGDARADSLMRLGVALEDREAARPVWSAFQRLMADEQPMAFLYHPDMLVAYDRRLRDVRPHVLSPFNNVREWWIAPADRRYPAAETSR